MLLDVASSSGRSGRSGQPRRPPQNDDFGALLAAGLLLGVGLIAASAARDENERRREAFRAKLGGSFHTLGVTLVAATLGRGANNVAFWDVTLQWPAGEMLGARVPLPPTIEPYSDQALSVVVDNVAKSILNRG